MYAGRDGGVIDINRREIKMKANCYDCKYRGNVPGDAHSCCRYPGTKHGLFDVFDPENRVIRAKLNIKADRHGVVSGWFMWPCNFDPCWLENCDGFTPKEESK